MFGQYCQGNQPDHEAPFEYHFIGKPEKSQKIIDYILDSLYGISAEGLSKGKVLVIKKPGTGRALSSITVNGKRLMAICTA